MMKYDINQNPKPGAVFVLSLIPGVGHMYMGLMTRGLQILIGFMLCCALLSFTYSISFLIGPAMTVLYIFNIFDAYNCRKRIQSGVEVADEPIVESGSIYVGIGLMVLGALGVIYTLDDLPYVWNYRLVEDVIRFLPSVLLLLFGLILILRARKSGRKGKGKTGEDRAA